MLIYMDCDGVLANWVEGIQLAAEIEPSIWDTVGHGLLPTEQQAKIDAVMAERSFWIALALYPWAKDLVDWASSWGKVVFCTQPFSSPGCLAGKYEWLNTHFGATMDNIVFIKQKWLLAHPTCLLLDDNVENCNRFQWRGGHSIVFPQPWNSAGMPLEQPEMREKSLEQIRTSIRNISSIVRWYS